MAQASYGDSTNRILVRDIENMQKILDKSDKSFFSGCFTEFVVICGGQIRLEGACLAVQDIR